MPDTIPTSIRFINLKSLRERTREECGRRVVRLARFSGVVCASLPGQEQVPSSLHELQQNHDYEGSTPNQAACALRLFLRVHVGRADWTCRAQIRIERTAPIPTVLSREEALARLYAQVIPQPAAH